MSDELKRAMDKLSFVKLKGAEYMTHLGYPDCVAILDEIKRLRAELQFIQEMAAEDIRAGEASGSTWQIEANARAALESKDAS